MTKMTILHLMAVKNAAEGARKMAISFDENREVSGLLTAEYRRLSEVAAHLAAQIEGADDAG
jgi:hypothetical protein